MMLNQEIPKLDTKGLRQFGLMLGAILVIVLGVFLPWVWGWESFPNIQWIGAGVGVIVWVLIAPNSIRGFYNVWMRIAMAIGYVINNIILAIVFYSVITPMGFIKRILGKDSMHRKLEKNVESYRVLSKIRKKNHFERPF